MRVKPAVAIAEELHRAVRRNEESGSDRLERCAAESWPALSQAELLRGELRARSLVPAQSLCIAWMGVRAGTQGFDDVFRASDASRSHTLTGSPGAVDAVA